MSGDDAFVGMNEDVVDRVSEENLNRALRFRKPVPLHTGLCVWCEELAMPNSAFCCADCRMDYEQDQRIRKIEGKL